MKPLLQIVDLEICFHTDASSRRLVTSGFHLDIFPHETLALIGESGCGKTTVALAILRLIAGPGKITAGKILYKNENLLELSEPRLRQIRWKELALIFQEPVSALNPLRRVGSQITEVLRLHLQLDKPAAKARALQLLESVSLPARCLAAYPHELSSGMRQRAMIAMAMACQPQLLIADEPTTALDAQTRHAVLECLLRLKNDLGCSLLFISHDLGLVAQFADRLAIMHEGKIVEAGKATSVWTHPQHPQTRRLLAAAKRFHPTP